MCWHRELTAKDKSGRVNVKYWKAPTKLRYSVRSGRKSSKAEESLELDTNDDEHGLQMDIFCRERTSMAYLD